MSEHQTDHDEYSRMAWLISKVVTLVIYWYLVAVEVILLLGFLLLLAGANPDSSFVSWAYRSLDRAMEPFRGMFNQVDLGEGGAGVVSSVFDTSILFAMVVYGLFLAGCAALLHWINRRIRVMNAEDRVADRQRAYQQARSSWTQSDAGPLPDVVGMQESNQGRTAAMANGAPPGAPQHRPTQSSWDEASRFAEGRAS